MDGVLEDTVAIVCNHILEACMCTHRRAHTHRHTDAHAYSRRTKVWCLRLQAKGEPFSHESPITCIFSCDLAEDILRRFKSNVIIYIYIEREIHIYVYIYIYLERERERERERD